MTVITGYFPADSVVIQPVQPTASSVASADRGTAEAPEVCNNRDHGQSQIASPSVVATVHPQVQQQQHQQQVSSTTAMVTADDGARQSQMLMQAHCKRGSVVDLMDKLLEDIYRVSSDSARSESSPDPTNWNEGATIVSGWSKRLNRKSVEELSTTVELLRDQLNVCCESLLKALKRRDILIARRDAKCNMITALLHAYSMKRNRSAFEPLPSPSSSSSSRRRSTGDNRTRKNRYSLSKHIWNTGDVMNGLLNTLKNIASLSEDTKMRFNMKPGPGDSDFEQWQSAMKMVARLPDGVPHEFRNTLWLTLAEKYLASRDVDWPKVERLCFNDTTNPDDEELGVQIVKDLHRTGCSLFCGSSGLENQALLKRVLLGFARWNKAVGYCQGFNMLAALILQVMEKNESDALKVMIYLIEGVLPEGYFANNLRGLSVDMAVFRDLLRVRLQNLSRHLDRLQTESKDSGTSYEPPLTNVFTMQWFLTLFCNCLPQRTVLRVWDLIFLEGSTVLLKTALAIWDALSDRIMTVTSADEFYSIMAVLTREMLEFGLMDANNLINTIGTMNELVEVKELRERYMYNINPWVSHMAKRGLRLFYTESDVEETDSDDDVDGGGKSSTMNVKTNVDGKDRPRQKNGKTGRINRQPIPSLESEREKVALDISSLKKQYCKLKERQKQVQVILTAACNGQNFISTSNSSAMNHLLFGKTALRCTSIGPIPGSIPLKYVQDINKLETLTETRVQEKRTISSLSSSSTSTELCDDPVSDCCSDRAADDLDHDLDLDHVYGHKHDRSNSCDRDPIYHDHDGMTVFDKNTDHCRKDVKIDDDDDVSLAEILRANSELLNRMCRGSSLTVTPEATKTVAIVDNRLPDSDERLQDSEELLPDSDKRLPDSDNRLPNSDRWLPDSIDDVESLAASADTSEDRRYSFADESSECSVNEISRLWGSKHDDDSGASAKPYAPFPSKVRQPKRLGIELGLYPDESN